MEANRRYFPECGNTTATATVSAKVTATASVATAAAAASMVSEAFDASIANNNVNNNYTQGMALLNRFLRYIGLKIGFKLLYHIVISFMFRNKIFRGKEWK